jgi:hypothetical protein
VNQSEIKIFAGFSIIIGAIVWLVAYKITPFEVVSFDSLKYINMGITAAGLFWFCYFKWIWKWDYINKLLYRPNLNGTWLGEFESDWKNSQGETNPPKRFVLVIRQSWFSISINAFTNLQRTESYAETLVLENTKGKKQLAYLFSEKFSGVGGQDSRQGAAELDFADSNLRKVLAGHFWTRAGTIGYIKVKKASNRQFIESFEESEEIWSDKTFWQKL